MANTDRNSFFVLHFMLDQDRGSVGLGIFNSPDHMREVADKIEEKLRDNEATPGKEEASGLDSVAKDFFEQFIAMLDLLPMGIERTGLLRSVIIQDCVTDHIIPHGTTLKADGIAKIYEVPYPLLTRVNRQVTRAIRQTHSLGIVPSISLLGLVSQFDGFLGRLLRKIYELNPNLIRNIETRVSVNEVLASGSFDQFRDTVIDQEVDRVLRMSHKDHIEYFEKLFKTEIASQISDWNGFLEVFERRNLYAHAAGRVSRTYLQNVPKENAPELGSELPITSEYMARATGLLLEVGLKLFHIICRTKSLKHHMRDADKALIDQTYELLVHEHYSVARGLLDLSLDPKLGIADPISRIVLSVNKAICYSNTGDSASVTEILKDFEEMPLDARYKIPILAVLGKNDAACEMLRAQSSDQIRMQELLDWPAFRSLHGDPQFREIIAKKFPDDFKLYSDVVGRPRSSAEDPGGEAAGSEDPSEATLDINGRGNEL